MLFKSIHNNIFEISLTTISYIKTYGILTASYLDRCFPSLSLCFDDRLLCGLLDLDLDLRCLE